MAFFIFRPIGLLFFFRLLYQKLSRSLEVGNGAIQLAEPIRSLFFWRRF